MNKIKCVFRYGMCITYNTQLNFYDVYNFGFSKNSIND